jgi:hypothetical protein
MVEGKLASDRDFDDEFILIDGKRFLEILTRVAGAGGIVDNDVYTISSDQKLSIIPFQDVRESRLLEAQEELINGYCDFRDGAFRFESEIYKPKAGECCASGGFYHASYRLTGGFKENTQTHVSEPQFKFVIENEWRSNAR